MDDERRNSLIRRFHYMGFTNKESVICLEKEGYVLSERHLKRIKRHLGLWRYKNQDIDTAVDVIQAEVQGDGSNLGYRSMWQRLRVTYGISIAQSSVAFCLKNLDPEGVEARRRHRLRRRRYRSRGPLYCIHVDGYDKLKPFGFAIHGAVDGFSKKVLWLKVGRTNKQPEVIAGYFLDFVKAMGGTARQIRMDCGTENVSLADMQTALRYSDNDDCAGEKSVLMGSSITNQRIERYWGMLRQKHMQFYIDLFRDMVDQGLYNPAQELQLECMRFAFMQLLQAELDHICEEHNSHRPQASRHTDMMPQKPAILFDIPEILGATSFLCPVSQNDTDFLDQFVMRLHPSGTTEEYQEIFSEVMQVQQLDYPVTSDDALELYAEVVDACQEMHH